MSFRMCANCDKVINNNNVPQEECPKCNSTKMNNPDEYNNEWQIIYDLQYQVLKLKLEKQKLQDIIDLKE